MTSGSEHFDVLIIGGGPGGLAAALWCADLGLKSALFEREIEFGGQMLWTFNTINNYLGISNMTGRELRDRFLQHVENADVKRLSGIAVTDIELAGKRVILADGATFNSAAIIVATGVRRRKLGVPGEDEFAGRGILDSGVKNRAKVGGKIVIIVGGGDAALENAIILSETANEVIVVHRRSEHSARKEFIERANERSNISFIFRATITRIVGESTVTGVELQDAISGHRKTLAADAVLIRIGVIPNTELVHGKLALDEYGYIQVNSDCSTDVDGIYAVGDVANRASPTISSAVGMAATAAKSVKNLLART